MKVRPPRRAALTRWARELALGVRLSPAGGRTGWVRLALISLGVALGVMMLLTAATIPTLMAARDSRIAARAVDGSQSLQRSVDTLLSTDARSEYRDRTITGRLLQPEGERAPLPPGVTRQLAPGEMVASPALARLLAEEEGVLLRGRWNERLVGTIGEAGLSGPGEYAFYLGTARLTEDTATRIRSFGRSDFDEGVPPALLLLGVVGLVVVLVPVAVFMATAVRFGGEARDRQLAALRLVGADTAATRRIAAGETLAGALLGLVGGGLLHQAVGVLAGRFVPPGLSFYPADFRPVSALAVLVAALVPVTAVLVTLSALRRVVVEPLGVMRRAVHRRQRLWWRLLLPAAGVALLYPLRGGLTDRGDEFVPQVVAGMAALLVGVALLLPWAVQATVRRLGGGSLGWQLAVRRLQLDGGTAVRAVSGIAVSAAGVIALQGLLAAVQNQYTIETGYGIGRFQAEVWGGESDERRWSAALQNAPEVRAIGLATAATATPSGPGGPAAGVEVVVGDCAVLRQFAAIDTCGDGDAFAIGGEFGAPPRPGSTYTLGAVDGSAAQWTLPTTARAVAGTSTPTSGYPTILATPAALDAIRPDLTLRSIYVALDALDPDALDRLRNTVARVDPIATASPVPRRTFEATLTGIRQAVLVGAVALLLVIGASMLVNVVEQLRERRRLLAVLVAVGIRRTTLTASILYQVAIPVLLGLALAVVTGGGLAAILLTAISAPIRFDWAGIGATAGAAVLIIFFTTTASLPLLWRVTKPDGLRSE